MFDTVTSHFLAFSALLLPTAALYAWVYRAQARVLALFPPAATARQPVSAMWLLLATGVLGVVYGMDWPHDVTVAVGSLIFVSGWFGRNLVLRWYLTGLFAGSLAVTTPAPVSHLAIDSFGDPVVLAAAMIAIFGAAGLFHFLPRRGATETTDAVTLHWRQAVTFSALLLAVAFVAARWPWASPLRAGFLAQAPLGIALGISFCFVLQCAAALEVWYRRLAPCARDDYALYVMTALIAVALAMIGLQLRLAGPVLWIAHLASAGILTASCAIDPIPPILTMPKPKPQATTSTS